MAKTDKDQSIECSSKFKKTIKELFNNKDLIDDLVNNFESDTNDFVNELIQIQNITNIKRIREIYSNCENVLFLDAININSFKDKSETEKELLLINIYNDYQDQLARLIEAFKSINNINYDINNLHIHITKIDDVLSEEIPSDPLNKLFTKYFKNAIDPKYFKHQINMKSSEILGNGDIQNTITICRSLIDTANKYKTERFGNHINVMGINKERWFIISQLCKENLKGISQALINKPKRGRPSTKIYPIHALKKEYIELLTKIEKHILKNFKQYLDTTILDGREVYTIKDSTFLNKIIGSLKDTLNDEYKYQLNELYTHISDKLGKGYRLKDMSFNTSQNIAKHIIAGANRLKFIELNNALNRHTAFDTK